MDSHQCGGGCWVCQAAEDARAKRYPRTPVGKELAAQAKGGGGRGSAAVAGLESYTRKTAGLSGTGVPFLYNSLQGSHL